MDVIVACASAWFYVIHRMAPEDLQRIYVLVMNGGGRYGGAVHTHASLETVPFLNKVEYVVVPCRRTDLSAYMAGRLAGARAAFPVQVPMVRMLMPSSSHLTIVTDDTTLWRSDDFQGHADGYTGGVELVHVAAPRQRPRNLCHGQRPRMNENAARAPKAAAPRNNKPVVAEEQYSSSAESSEEEEEEYDGMEEI